MHNSKEKMKSHNQESYHICFDEISVKQPENERDNEGRKEVEPGELKGFRYCHKTIILPEPMKNKEESQQIQEDGFRF
jgi:hypothetical protein